MFDVVFAASWGCFDEFARVVNSEVFKVTPLLLSSCVTSCALFTSFLLFVSSLSLWFSSLFTLYLEFVHDFSTLYTLFRSYNLQKLFNFNFLHVNVIFNRCFWFFLKFHAYVYIAQNLIFTNWRIGSVRPDQPEGGPK